MAFATLANVRAAVAQIAEVYVTISTPNFGSEGVLSFWTYSKVPGGAGAAPAAAGANPTKATAGAIQFRNAGAGNELRLVGLDVWVPKTTDVLGTFLLYDRLWASGGHDATSTALVSFTSAITRGDTTGEGVELWLEIYTTIGNTSSTATITYTNQAGTGGRTATVAITSANVAARMAYLVQLQAGDTGVRSVESVQLSASTGTVGSYGLTMVRPLTAFAMRPVADDRSQHVIDLLGLGFPKIEDDACLALAVLRGAALSGTMAQCGLTFDFREA